MKPQITFTTFLQYLKWWKSAEQYEPEEIAGKKIEVFKLRMGNTMAFISLAVEFIQLGAFAFIPNIPNWSTAEAVLPKIFKVFLFDFRQFTGPFAGFWLSVALVFFWQVRRNMDLKSNLKF